MDINEYYNFNADRFKPHKKDIFLKKFNEEYCVDYIIEPYAHLFHGECCGVEYSTCVFSFALGVPRCKINRVFSKTRIMNLIKIFEENNVCVMEVGYRAYLKIYKR